MRYGVYGGSFDPIHRGHVAAAETVLAACELDHVLFMPSASPPHKRGRRRAPFVHRVAMVALAVAGREGLRVSDLEGRRSGPSYSFDTLAELRARAPDAQPELMVGADMLEDLPNWYRADEMVAATPILAFGRPGWDAARARKAFESRFPAGILRWVEVAPVEASSTEVRRRVAAGEDAGDLLPEPVLAYILKNGLYRDEG